MVPDNAAGAARAYKASETGKMFANPMLLSKWNVNSQPNETFPPAVVASAAPAAKDRKPGHSNKAADADFIDLSGLGCFFDQTRQNMTAPARQLTDKIESTVISQVVGIVFPKKNEIGVALRPNEIGIKDLLIANDRNCQDG